MKTLEGQTFVAETWGYSYRWKIVSPIHTSKLGDPFVWAIPIERLPGKQKRGRISAPTVFHLTHLPPLHEALARS